jgi:hypothetical protein
MTTRRITIDQFLKHLPRTEEELEEREEIEAWRRAQRAAATAAAVVQAERRRARQRLAADRRQGIRVIGIEGGSILGL